LEKESEKVSKLWRESHPGNLSQVASAAWAEIRRVRTIDILFSLKITPACALVQHQFPQERIILRRSRKYLVSAIQPQFASTFETIELERVE
jgi:hypothetical protein